MKSKNCFGDGKGWNTVPLRLKLGVVHWEHRNVDNYEHWVMQKVFGLPQAPSVFLFHICCRVRAQWFELLDSWKPKKKANQTKSPKQNQEQRTGKASVLFLPLSHYSGPSQPSFIRWRIFRLLFGTCLLYLLRVRCCQVEEKNANSCHSPLTPASSSSGS